jgi:hypothetical protein
MPKASREWVVVGAFIGSSESRLVLADIKELTGYWGGRPGRELCRVCGICCPHMIKIALALHHNGPHCALMNPSRVHRETLSYAYERANTNTARCNNHSMMRTL